jgi:(p)ppGpp synthase/HD superfamily hydrolase
MAEAIMEDDLRRQFAIEQEVRILAEIGLNDIAEADFLAALAGKFKESDTLKIVDALNFSKSIEYIHHGLSSRAYLNHPLRVATFVLQESPRLNYKTTIVGLLHNVLETSTVGIDELISRFGNEISSAIEILTIDRSNEDEEYKRRYYEMIRKGPAGASTVKILDKFDNVFMICFNPSEDVRAAYLDEIECMVLPLAEVVLPKLHGYFVALTKYMREIGYVDKQLIIKAMLI